MSDQTQNEHNTENDREREGRSSRQGFQNVLDQIVSGIRSLISEGNRRHLIVRNQQERTLLRLPLTIAVIALLLVAWLRLLPLLVIAVIVALVLRVKFALTKDSPPY